MELILASSSPRRSALLKQIDIAHRIVPADIDETPHAHESPCESATRFAREKAHKVAKQFPNSAVLAADTIGILDGQLLNKPQNAENAIAMLTKMAGRSHQVITAFTLLYQQREISGQSVSEVHMIKAAPSLIHAYVASGEPLDKAGSYGIQGAGAILIERIIGDYSNIVGLPLASVLPALASIGIYPLQSVAPNSLCLNLGNHDEHPYTNHPLANPNR